MKATKFVLFGMLFLAVSFQTMAQERGERPRRAGTGPDRMITAMKERLDLSQEQVAKIQDIYRTSREEFGKLRQEDAEANRARRDEFRKIREKQQKEIDQVLTEEQRKEWKAWMEERQNQPRRRPRPQRDQ